ncbi:MAG: efflux RND transporter periplasmic adaptor subunit [Burkholderiales bacterium]|nr:efflux RND transporter periplasmic adaptor subunit [Burkholderiales bacterium]
MIRTRDFRFSAIIVACACAAACRAAPDARQQPASDTPGEVRFAAGAPQLAYIGVDTVSARRDRVVAVLPAELAFDEDHTVRVLSPVSGRIGSLDAQLGDRVRAHGALAHVNSSDMAQARSDLAKAVSQASQAGAALVRARDLFDHHVIARRDLEQAENDDAQARADLARARQHLDLLGGGAGAEGEYVLRSPIAGEVVDRTANPGQEVQPGAAPPLFTISSLDTLWLLASVYQRDLPLLKPAARLVFTTDAAPGRSFEAIVRTIGNALDPQARTAQLRAVLPNPGRLLRPQTIGNARLVVREPAAMPVVPSSALVTRDSGMVAFVEVGPGHFQRRDVVVAEDDGQVATIVRGLRVGERVVTRGSVLVAAEANRTR